MPIKQHYYIRISLATCLVVLYAVEVVAQDNNGNDDNIQISSNADICATITKKAASGKALTLEEGDKLFECYYPKNPDHSTEENPDHGFRASTTLPNLYDLQDFNDFPGVLGGGLAGN